MPTILDVRQPCLALPCKWPFSMGVRFKVALLGLLGIGSHAYCPVADVLHRADFARHVISSFLRLHPQLYKRPTRTSNRKPQVAGKN